MANYRKLVAALVGLGLILLKRWTGVDVPGLSDLLIDLVMSSATAIAVWFFPNSLAAAPISDAGTNSAGRPSGRAAPR